MNKVNKDEEKKKNELISFVYASVRDMFRLVEIRTKPRKRERERERIYSIFGKNRTSLFSSAYVK